MIPLYCRIMHETARELSCSLIFGSMSIVGVEAKTKNRNSCRSESSGTILCMAEENSVFEIAEVTHPEADSLQDFSFVVAAFNKSI